MARIGRPKKTKNIPELINRMLDKRDYIDENGILRSRREALIERLWQAASNPENKNTRLLTLLLEYAEGKPTTIDKMPDTEENETDTSIDDLLKIPDFVNEIIKTKKKDG